MGIQGWSSIATRVPHPRDVTDRAKEQAYGFCVHTTGSGVPRRAKELGVDPLVVALDIYLEPDDPAHGVFTSFPHYVISSSGALVQIANDRERARHAGISVGDRAMYLSGAWRSKVSSAGLALWDSKWGLKSPLGLFPSRSPNEDLLACEMIPLLAPLPNGSLFTPVQYDLLAALLDDVEVRHRISLSGRRLVAHEDIEPLARWNRYGWDPGALAPTPVFLWADVHARRRR